MEDSLCYDFGPFQVREKILGDSPLVELAQQVFGIAPFLSSGTNVLADCDRDLTKRGGIRDVLPGFPDHLVREALRLEAFGFVGPKFLARGRWDLDGPSAIGAWDG